MEDAETEKPKLKWLTAADAAAQLGINTTTIYHLCQAGKIAHHRIGSGGGRIKFTQANIDEYISSTLVPIQAKKDQDLPKGTQVTSKWFRPRGSKPSKPA